FQASSQGQRPSSLSWLDSFILSVSLYARKATIDSAPALPSIHDRKKNARKLLDENFSAVYQKYDPDHSLKQMADYFKRMRKDQLKRYVPDSVPYLHQNMSNPAARPAINCLVSRLPSLELRAYAHPYEVRLLEQILESGIRG
ncbi:hypothetical protein PMAYCL1PPCAC_03744, partial [Pristionchus mayeri]